MTEEVLVPYILTALAVGGIVNALRYWGRNRLFLQHIVAILLGAGFGLLVDGGANGFRAGVAVGGVAIPVYDLIVTRIRARKQVARNEHIEESS
jgi:hypothetical protein